MPVTRKIKALDGTDVEFVDEIIGSGGMKDVYFSPDRTYVVAFFRDKQDFNAKDRLLNIAGPYRDRIYNQVGGEYWKDKFCWPTKVVEYEGRLGLVAPVYPKQFFFQFGSKNDDFLGIRGKEKEGKWFASANNQNKFLDTRERGNWVQYFRIGILLSRSVRRMHAAGLAHSDLSYKNVLVDPVTGGAAIIDIDGLVVPGKYPPDVVGTPDFIAPEVMATNHLPKGDPNRKLPSRTTDLHALAVLVYMYLLYRHPLRGGKVHAKDPQKDEELSMGSKALFVEHPTNKSNRPNLNDVRPSYLPWADIMKRPYTITGPYLKTLFDKAFVDGLHNPGLRPTADEWEQALVKTIDLMQPCQNPDCEQKWFVFDNSTKPVCPFCGTPFRGQLPVLNLYSARTPGNFKPDNHRLMVYSNQYIYPWHASNHIFPNERLTDSERQPVGYFVFHQGRWVLVNQTLADLTDVSEQKTIPIGQMLEIRDGQQILLSKQNGGRLAVVQLISN
ncbi:protein kinase domain-containing protein [Spirosoma lituiforme]